MPLSTDSEIIIWPTVLSARSCEFLPIHVQLSFELRVHGEFPMQTSKDFSPTLYDSSSLLFFFKEIVYLFIMVKHT